MKLADPATHCFGEILNSSRYSDHYHFGPLKNIDNY